MKFQSRRGAPNSLGHPLSPWPGLRSDRNELRGLKALSVPVHGERLVAGSAASSAPPAAAVCHPPRALRGAERGGPAGLPHCRAGGRSQTRAECDTYLPAPGSTAPAVSPARGCAAARPAPSPGPRAAVHNAGGGEGGERAEASPAAPSAFASAIPIPDTAAAPLQQRRGINLAENRTH